MFGCQQLQGPAKGLQAGSRGDRGLALGPGWDVGALGAVTLKLTRGLASDVSCKASNVRDYHK